MIRYLLIVTALLSIGFALVESAVPSPASGESCKPTYAVLDNPVKVLVGASELSFRLLAVGCSGSLPAAWPPKIKELEKEFAIELREPHPVQTLFLIRERSPALRQRLTRKLNSVLGRPVVYDVFLFDAKAAE